VTLTPADFSRDPNAGQLPGVRVVPAVGVEDGEPSAERRALGSGEPGVVTDRSRPSLAVTKHPDCLHVTGQPCDVDLAAWLEMDEPVEFEPPVIGLGLRAVDL